MEINEDKPKRTRRKKDEMGQLIEAAATRLIEKNGFSEVTLYSIAKEADISILSLRNKYGTTAKFLAEFIKDKQYWLNGILEKNFKKFEAGDHELFLASLLKGIAKRLNDDKVMQELLIWEVQKKNEVTKKTAVLREANTSMYNQFYNDLFKNTDSTSVSFNGFMAIMIAGIYYLILHKKVSTFCGLNLKKKEGMDLLLKTIENMTSQFFDQVRGDKKTLKIVRKLKEKGISIDIISDCTGLSIEQINNLA